MTHFCHEDLYFIFAKSVDPEEMLLYAAFPQALHCLPKYLFEGIPNEKGLTEHRVKYQ